MLSLIIPSVMFLYLYVVCLYAACYYAECRYAECRGTHFCALLLHNSSVVKSIEAIPVDTVGRGIGIAQSSLLLALPVEGFLRVLWFPLNLLI